MENVKIGDKIKVSKNLPEVMKKIDFDNGEISLCQELIGKQYTVLDIWREKTQSYATIDLCVEIPFKSCEKI